MSIRLNKAIKELNIGLQTAVEFLAKRPELGEVKPEPTCKISEEQYEALSNAFAKDKEVRTQAEKLFQKKPKDQKEKKEQKEEKSAEKKEKSAPRETVRQEYKPLGKIDLDAINGKKAEPKKAEKPVEEKKPEPKYRFPKTPLILVWSSWSLFHRLCYLSCFKRIGYHV